MPQSPDSPKVLTYLFGLNLHSIVVHAPFLLRIVSPRSTSAEMFERLFEKRSDITTKTWSKRIEDLSSNAVLHYRAEKGAGESNVIREEREMKSLPKLGNTVFSKEVLYKYADDWQACSLNQAPLDQGYQDDIRDHIDQLNNFADLDNELDDTECDTLPEEEPAIDDEELLLAEANSADLEANCARCSLPVFRGKTRFRQS